MNNKKKLMISGASALAMGVIGIGAYAYFSDSDTVDGTATVGTVNVTATGNLTHSGVTFKADGSIENPGLNNLNPGDNDPTNPDGYRPGTDHELTYTITNEGNKSVITRSIIRVSGTYKDEAGVTQKLSDTDLAKIIISERKDASAAVGADDSDKKTEVTALTGAQMVGDKLVYTIGGVDSADSLDVLDGKGANAETEENGVDSGSRAQTLDIGLAKEVTAANSHLMGAEIVIEVEVQAMQYRNTGDGAWATVFENTYKAPVQG